MSTLTEYSTTVDGRDRHVAWRDVLRGAAAGQVVMAAFMFLITVALERRFDPMSLVIGALVAVGVILLTKRPGKGGVIYAGVMSLLLLLMVVMFGGLTVLTRVRSTFELILMGGLLVVSLLGLVATAGALRQAGGPVAATAPKVAGACIAGLVAIGVVAGSRPPRLHDRGRRLHRPPRAGGGPRSLRRRTRHLSLLLLAPSRHGGRARGLVAVGSGG